jgi:hypothetical protein
MKLDVRLTHRFLDQLWCQAIVVFLFEITSRQEEYLSRINEALVRSLTPLLDTDFITGKKDELTLIATQQRIKADKLLFAGLGPASGYSARILPGVTKKVLSSLDRLRVDEFCFMVPRFEGGKGECEQFVRSVLRGTMDHYEHEKKGTDDFILRVFVSLDRDVCSDMYSLEQSLRSYLDTRIEYTVVIDESRG